VCELELSNAAVRKRQFVAQLGVLSAQPLVLLQHAAQPGAGGRIAGPSTDGRPWGDGLFLAAELLDRGAQLTVVVEELSANAGFGRDRLEGDHHAAPIKLGERAAGTLGG
jgi:hypothetical protein